MSEGEEALHEAEFRERKRKMSRPKKNTELSTLTLPKDLIDKAREKLLGERGIELETFVGIYLRMILRASKGILGLSDPFCFGKYNGERVEDVVRIDPSYVVWLITQDGRTKFEPEVLILANEMMKA